MQRIQEPEPIRGGDRVLRAGAGDSARSEKSNGRGQSAKQSWQRKQESEPVREGDRILRAGASDKASGEGSSGRGPHTQQFDASAAKREQQPTRHLLR